MAINHVKYENKDVINLTKDNVVNGNCILSGYTAHARNGEPIMGSLFSDQSNTFTIPDIYNKDSSQNLKEANIVKYGDKTLIDLSSDTIEPQYLVTGFVTRDKTGKQITGTFASGFPDILNVESMISDEKGATLTDESNNKITGSVTYKKTHHVLPTSSMDGYAVYMRQ